MIYGKASPMSKFDSLKSAPITKGITDFATGSLDRQGSEAALRMIRTSLFD